MHLNENNTWVVVADSSLCRIYEYHARPESIDLVREVLHPQSHLKDIDFKMDKDGSYHGAGGAGNYVSPDPKDHATDQFSREIAKLLNDNRNAHAFEHLIIITPPHLNGKLHHHMNKHVKKMVNLNIAKDLIQYKDEQLLRYLHARTHIH